MAAIEWSLMKYTDQQEIQLGDVVELAMPDGIRQARVVMLGSDYSHLALEQSFEQWLNKEKLLSKDSIVIEWINENPLAHTNPKYAPVGNYMTAAVSDDIKLIN